MRVRTSLTVILLLICLSLNIFANEKKARREKSFIIKLYKQGYYKEVLDGLSNFEKLYKKYMDEDLYLTKAESFYNTGDFEQALENYEKCIEISEKYKIYAKYSAGYCYMELKNYIKALKYFQEISELETPYREKAILNTARVFGKLVQLREAVRYYQEYMNISENVSDDILIEYAETLFSADSKEAGIKFVENSVEGKDTQESVIFYDKLADFYKRSGKNSKALEIYEKLLTYTGKAEYAFYAGIIYFNTSDYRNAVERFELSRENPSFSEESIFYKGQSLYLLLDFENARKEFQLLMKASNSRIAEKSGYFITASFYQEKKYSQALKFIQDNKIENNDILEIKRDIHIALGDYEKAIDQIRIILSKNINPGYNYYIAGQCYYNLQNFDRALANLELAESKSESANIRNSSIFEKASIYILKNDYEKALAEYSKIPANSPLSKEARFKIVDIYRKKKDYNKVLEYLENMKTDGTDSGYISYTKAEIFYEQDEKEKALEAISGIGRKSTYYEKSIIFNARILYDSEDYDNARKFIEDRLSDIGKENMTEFMYIYSNVLFNSGEYDKTIKVIEDILLKDKNRRSALSDDLRILLTRSYLKIRNFSQAEANASYVASETDNREYQIQAQYYLGEVYLMFGNHKQAVLEFLKCTLIDPESAYVPKAFLRTGECYQHMGRFEDAVTSYRKAAEKGNSIIKDISSKRIEKIEEVPAYIEI